MTDIQVKCFLALAEHLNFTQAARDLCISQSTLSMHISALEKNLALTLFIRTKRKVELSPEGEILYPVLKNVNEALEAAVTEAREKIISGEFDVFAGEIKDQNGNVMVAEGATLSDEELLKMTWFVEGVVGDTTMTQQ